MPPSCSAFHGRSGSSECALTTCGTSYSSADRCPAMLAYHVGVDQLGPGAADGDRQVDPEGAQRRVGADSSARSAYDDEALLPGLLGTRCAERDARGLDVVTGAQRRTSSATCAGAAVDLGWVLAGQHVDSHSPNLPADE